MNTNNCNQLPPLITLNDCKGNYAAFNSLTVARLKKDCENLTVNNKKVILQNNKIEHVFTRKCDNGERVLDLKRAERTVWIKPLLSECMQTDCADILSYLKPNPKNNRNRLHIMCFSQKVGYMVVLEEFKNIYFLITAFLIDPDKRCYYEREHQKFGK